MKKIRLLDLAKEIRLAIDDRFGGGQVWVEAETGNIRASQAGHIYLSLIDKSPAGELVAEVPAVIWSTSASIVRGFSEATGRAFAGNLKVCVLVRVAYHVRYGLKLIIEGIDAAYTIGELALERERTLQQLAANYPRFIRYQDGRVYSANQQLGRPAVFQRLAVLTAPDSEALTDFRHQLEHNPFAYRFHEKLWPVSVQGEQAGPQIARAIREAAGEKPDAIILIRGGGSQTDLYAFENAELAAAIAMCPVPVLTGIGHHRNSAIADLVAHESLSTPTKVAEWLIDYNRSFEERLLELQADVIAGAGNLLDYEKQRLESAAQGLGFGLRSLREKQKHRLTELITGTRHGIRLFLEKRKSAPEIALKDMAGSAAAYLLRRQNRLQLMETTVRMAAPDRIMQRGFAMLSVNGKIITSAENLSEGQELSVLLSKSEIITRISQIRPEKEPKT